MTTLQAALLGILQGATEFLPVSSSGHLVLVPWLLGWQDPGLIFDVIVHLGTLLAVLVYLWRDVVGLVGGFLSSVRYRRIATPHERLAWLVVTATVPGAVLGYALEDVFERLFSSPVAVLFFLLVTGILLYASDLLAVRRSAAGANARALAGVSSGVPRSDGVAAMARTDLTLRDALAMGFAQAAAIVPGISRSGATISAGLAVGLTRDAAARYSFLMSLPIIAGAAGSQLLDLGSDGLAQGWEPLAVGFFLAAASGYVAIRFLLRFVRTHSLRPFAYYCWGLGLLGIALYLMG